MNNFVMYICIALCSVFVSAISQILLKRSAKKEYTNKLHEYINPYTITAYSIYVLAFLVTTYCLKVIPLSMMPIIDSCGYIFVAVLSYVFFKEMYSKIQLIGIVSIFMGAVIYSVDLF